MMAPQHTAPSSTWFERTILDNGTTFIYAFVTSVFVYGVIVCNPLIHFDDEVSTAQASIYPMFDVAMGRWGTGAIKAFFTPFPIIPFFTPVMAIIFLAFSSLVVVRLFRLHGAVRIGFVVIFCSFPQFAYQLEFTMQADCVALGFLSSTLAFLAFSEAEYSSGYMRIMLGVCSVLVGAVALSFYQTLLLIPISLALLRSVDQLRRDARILSVFRSLANAVCFVVLIIFCYLVITKIIDLFFDVKASASYFSQQFMWKQRTLAVNLFDLRFQFRHMLTGQFYYGSLPYISVLLPSFLLTTFTRKINVAKRVALALALLLAIVSPFFMMIGMGHGLPARTYISHGIPLAVIWAVCFDECGVGLVWQFCVAAALASSGSYYSSRLFVSDLMSTAADRDLANRIDLQIYNRYPTFDPHATRVYFSGSYSPPNLWRLNNDFDVVGQSFFSFDGGINGRIVNLFEVLGVDRLFEASTEQIAKVKPAIKNLPVWPNPQSIQMVGGILVVHMGPESQ